jgi:hypothetical protein
MLVMQRKTANVLPGGMAVYTAHMSTSSQSSDFNQTYIAFSGSPHLHGFMLSGILVVLLISGVERFEM